MANYRQLRLHQENTCRKMMKWITKKSSEAKTQRIFGSKFGQFRLNAKTNWPVPAWVCSVTRLHEAEKASHSKDQEM